MSAMTSWKLREQKRKAARDADKAMITILQNEVNDLKKKLDQWHAWWYGDWDLDDKSLLFDLQEVEETCSRRQKQDVDDVYEILKMDEDVESAPLTPTATSQPLHAETPEKQISPAKKINELVELDDEPMRLSLVECLGIDLQKSGARVGQGASCFATCSTPATPH